MRYKPRYSGYYPVRPLGSGFISKVHVQASGDYISLGLPYSFQRKLLSLVHDRPPLARVYLKLAWCYPFSRYSREGAAHRMLSIGDV